MRIIGIESGGGRYLLTDDAEGTDPRLVRVLVVDAKEKHREGPYELQRLLKFGVWNECADNQTLVEEFMAYPVRPAK